MAAQGNYNGCKGCENRRVEPNCHSTCRVYLDFVEEKRRRRELQRKETNGRYNAFAYTQIKGEYYT